MLWRGHDLTTSLVSPQNKGYVFVAGTRQNAMTKRPAATSQSRSAASMDQGSHSPDISSQSDSEPEFQDRPAGDPDFAPAAREAASSGPKDSKTKLREKNKRAQKRFRARQKVLPAAVCKSCSRYWHALLRHRLTAQQPACQTCDFGCRHKV